MNESSFWINMLLWILILYSVIWILIIYSVVMPVFAMFLLLIERRTDLVKWLLLLGGPLTWVILISWYSLSKLLDYVDKLHTRRTSK